MNDINDSHILDVFKSDESPDKGNDTKELFNEKKVKTKTEVNSSEIHIIAGLKATSDFLKSNKVESEFIDEFINEYLTLKISLDRKSRSEFVNVKKNELMNKQAESGSGLNINNMGMR